MKGPLDLRAQLWDSSYLGLKVVPEPSKDAAVSLMETLSTQDKGQMGSGT